jgi:truncated hemoglobin YjbI
VLRYGEAVIETRSQELAQATAWRQTAEMNSTELFHRLGGMERASKIVLATYDRVLKSALLEPYFKDVDMRRLVEHQANFLVSAMGGPHSYSDEELRNIHGRLGIDRAAFQEMLEHLRNVMKLEGLADDDVESVITAYRRRESCIVTRGRGLTSRST